MLNEHEKNKGKITQNQVKYKNLKNQKKEKTKNLLVCGE